MIDIILGTLAGIITGIIPGLHPNLLATIAVHHSASSFFIIAGALAHTITNIIPLVFITTTNPEYALGLHPIAALTNKGFAHEALKLLCLGAFSGLLIATILTPAFLLIIPPLKTFLQPHILPALVFIVIFFIFYEKNVFKKCIAFSIFFLAGVTGLIVFDSDIPEPLFPLFTGLFGIPTLVMNMTTKKTTITQQKTDLIKPHFSSLLLTICASIASVLFVSFLPGISMAQSSLVATILFPTNPYQYIILLGSTAVLDYYFSFLFAILFAKTRNGVFEIIGPNQFSTTNIIPTLSVMLFATSTAILVTLTLATPLRKFLTHIPQQTLNLSVLLFLCLMTLFISGLPGILVLITSTSIGLLPILFNTSRTHLMGCLLLPLLLRLFGRNV